MTAASQVLIKGGHLVDPVNQIDEPADLLVAAGRITAVGAGLSATGEHTEVIDAAGKFVLPGLIDVHVHLRQPGFEYKETIATGLRAALAGGFVGVCPIPNTNPVSDSRPDMEFLTRESRRLGLIQLWPVGAVTLGQAGEQLTEFGELRKGGAVAISDDGNPIERPALMRRALEYSKKYDLPILVHGEDRGLSGDGAMNEGPVATRLGLAGSPCAAESVMIARDIEIAARAGGRLHFMHVSCARSVDLIRRAKLAGVPVSAETAPHYLHLTDEAVAGYNTNAKMYPPLRTADDVAAVRAGLADGTIEIVASDHAPHARYEKAVEFDHAPNGITGLETAVPLMLQLVDEGVLSWSQLVMAMSVAPARLIGVDHGSLAVGSAANVTVVDPDLEWTYDKSTCESLSHNSPYWGCKLRGRATDCLIDGRVALRATTIVPAAAALADAEPVVA
jgi:dihydroorotase